MAEFGYVAVSGGGQKRSGSGKSIDNQQGGYATNFGASLGGAGSRGIEGQLVASVCKAVVSRFAKSHKELKSPENMVCIKQKEFQFTHTLCWNYVVNLLK